MASSDNKATLVKVVYFDEESVSDLLDISAGGKEAQTTERVKERATDVHASADTKLAAKFNWLPFLGGSAEVGAGASASSLGRSIFNKTLSNTILTDYLAKAIEFPAVLRLGGLRLTAQKDSAAYTKMFTPYAALLKMDDLPVDLARMDEALEAAKGYYELVGEDANGNKKILRFNIQAFRNNYGLVDLGRMDLVFHGLRVGRAAESSLTMAAEMSPTGPAPTTAKELLQETSGEGDPGGLLDVYDVLLAGVEHVG